MVSDQDIAKGVETLLRQSDPNSLTSLNGVVQQLEAKLGLDLSEKAGFIRDQINLLLRAHPTTAAAVTAAVQPPTPAQSAVHVPAKGHFALQHPQQFPPTQPQQFPPPHFALQPHHLPHDLNFGQPHPAPVPQIPPQRRQQQQQLPRQSPVLAAQGATAGVSVDQAPKESAPAGSKRRGGPGGLNKVCGVSPELQAIVGEPALPRTEIVKQLWAYIRKNNLQDPSNKRKIICDDALRVVFETDCTDMFKMNKLLAKHILPLEPTSKVEIRFSKDGDALALSVCGFGYFNFTDSWIPLAEESGQAKRAKVDVESTTETTEPACSTVIISEPLAKFFGTGETEMMETEVMRRVWEYIKLNHLEDPINPMAIQCDEKLRDLLGYESISAVGINEMLRSHLFKRS